MNRFAKLFLLLIGLTLSGCVIEPVHPSHSYNYYDSVYEPIYYDPVIHPYWGWPYHHHHRHWR